LKKYQKQLQVGSLNSKPKPTAPPAPPKQEVVKPAPAPRTATPAPAHVTAEALEPYGDLVPYADPNWYHSYHSPYFNQTHADLRAEVREWVESEIIPNVTEWDEAKKVPDEIYKQMGTRGYLAGLLGSHHYPKHLVKNTVKSVPPEKWDLFHEVLVTDELCRAASGGFVWNLIGGFGIGCPPVLRFGKKSLVERILPGILAGDKRICLAITEPGK
jgi:alkylation response protein AidB-like acyl-CoA dehydrogenase